MKKARIISVMALFSVMWASCIFFPDPLPPKAPDYDILPDNLAEGFFYAQNTATRKFYIVEAERLWENDKCEIWVEVGSGVTIEQAKDIAREYSEKIRPRVVDAFSEKNIPVEYEDEKIVFEIVFNDILDFANWLVDRDDGKLTILLLDIQDGYDEEIGSYVAGYFSYSDFYPKGRIDSWYYSNGRDMIYVDTNPGMKNEHLTQAYATFAHELQHLVNFAISILIKRFNSQGELLLTDTWITEGLSAYAEYLYLEENPPDRCRWLLNEKNTIHKGNNFFVWGNHMEDPGSLAIHDDYATVYLFFRWLYLQADTNLRQHIFRDISHSRYPDYRAVTGVVGSNWETLLRRWLAANYYPQNTDYGYKGDDDLQDKIYIRHIFVPGNRIPLYPGEGVYSIINNSFSVANEFNIRYAGLAANTATIDISSPYSGDVLLTFNINTSIDPKNAVPENGSLTGVFSVSRTTADNARQAGKWTGPFVIDAQDMLGRDQDRPKFHLPR